MDKIIFTAGNCTRCKIAKEFMEEKEINYLEVDIKQNGMDDFKEFYKANRTSIYRGKEGIEFPIFSDGAEVRQGVSVVIGYLLSGKHLDYFIGRSQLSSGWVNGLHVSGGDNSNSDDFITVLRFLKKNGLKLQLDTNGKNAPILEKIMKEGLGDRVIMDVKGPLAIYDKIIEEDIDIDDIKTSIYLLPGFPEHEFQTTIVPVVRNKDTEVVSYLTPEEIGETANLIKEVTGSSNHKYVLKCRGPEGWTQDKRNKLEPLLERQMLKYRTLAQKHLSGIEFKKI